MTLKEEIINLTEDKSQKERQIKLFKHKINQFLHNNNMTIDDLDIEDHKYQKYERDEIKPLFNSKMSEKTYYDVLDKMIRQ